MNTEDKKEVWQLTNDEIIARVNAWQDAGFVHPLTCYNSKHPNLIPIVQNKKVVLQCPKCRYIQESIPPSVLQVDPALLESEKKRLIEMGAKFDKQ